MIDKTQILFFLGLCCFQSHALSAELETPDTQSRHKFRVEVNSLMKYPLNPQDSSNYSAGKGSTFYIYQSDPVFIKDASGNIIPDADGNKQVEKYQHVIKFSGTSKPKCLKSSPACNQVEENQFYVLDSDKIENFYYKASGVGHGVIIVPFKIRADDGTLAGQSSLGYYIGNRRDRLLGSGTLFGSIGLTQVDVPVSGDNTDSRTGLTVAGGYLFQFSDGFEVAVVGGFDHLGGEAGDDWQYEDDFWFSIGLGFNLAKDN